MKTIKLLIIVSFIMISSVCYGQDSKVVKFGYHESVHVKTVCIERYLFVIAKTPNHNGVSITQVFRNGMLKGTIIPIKCKDKQ